MLMRSYHDSITVSLAALIARRAVSGYRSSLSRGLSFFSGRTFSFHIFIQAWVMPEFERYGEIIKSC
jgi:hypothetical protein